MRRPGPTSGPANTLLYLESRRRVRGPSVARTILLPRSSWRAVAPVGHPLTAKAELSPQALEGQSFIVREQGSGTRAALEKFLQTARVEPRITMEMASNETIKQAVMAGMALSFLSLHTLGLELDNQLIARLNVQGAPVVRSWNVVHTLSKILSPAAEAFRYFILERGEAYLAEQFARHTT